MTLTDKAILFDLDGTLLDTAPDLLFVLNKMRKRRGLHPLPLAEVRGLMNEGSKYLVRHLFNMSETSPQFNEVRHEFLSLYETHLADSTQLFTGMEEVLNYVAQHQIPWAIVTNKLTRHALPLLKALNLIHLPHTIVCGDTLSTAKPDPAPIEWACKKINRTPQSCLYVGDAKTDVLASRAAGTQVIVALYGYIGADNPHDWLADGYINQPHEIINWLHKSL